MIPAPVDLHGLEMLAFGPFRLFPESRMLLRGEVPLAIGSRALDILIVLARRPGEIIPNAEIASLVWRDMHVDESNLRVHVAGLRKAMSGAEYVVNVPNRGYGLALPVTYHGPTMAAPARRHFPLPIAHVLGRGDRVEETLRALQMRRLVTLVGPGGIGKTTLALAALEALPAEAGRLDFFADLAPMGAGRLNAAGLAALLGFPAQADDPLLMLKTRLGAAPALLMLDNCEHVILQSASLAEALLRAAPGLRILATSREPLRAEGELVLRVPGLALPPEGADEQAMLASPAVALFLERAASEPEGLAAARDDLPSVTAICRQLDGIPLAIELAAARAGAFSPRDLLARLGDRLNLLTRGRRTALARHQTLRAALDWSYDLLTEAEQRLLGALSFFRGEFSLACAGAVAFDELGGGVAAIDAVSSLAAKSLLSVRMSNGAARYRLLDTTRVYVSDKLDPCMARRYANRHARYCLLLIEELDAELHASAIAKAAQEKIRGLDDLEAGLAWSFSPDGDSRTGIDLTIAALPVWLRLSLYDDCIGWVERALDALEASPAPDDESRMKLYTALGLPRLPKPGRPSGAAAWQMVLELAEKLGNIAYQLRALRALWGAAGNRGAIGEAIFLARRFQALAEGSDMADRLVGKRILAVSLHQVGRLELARLLGEQVLAGFLALSPDSLSTLRLRYPYDLMVEMRTTNARVLWLQGHTDEALTCVERNIAEAQREGHRVSLSYALMHGAAPLALYAGELEAARRYIALLRENTALRALDAWHLHADCYDGILLILQGQAADGLERLRLSGAALAKGGFMLSRPAFLSYQSLALNQLGRHGEALRAIDEALELSRQGGQLWLLAELLRQRAQSMLHLDRFAEAEALLQEALEVARAQGALAWEMRVAQDLAALWRRDGRQREALDLLVQIHGKAGEGFGQPPLLALETLLKELGAPGVG